MKKPKIKIRQRIYITFLAVLFFSYLLTGIISNFVLEFLHPVRGSERFSDYHLLARNNTFILVLLIMFFVTAIATYFLSNSITRPIEKLDKFALNIGKGNFVPNDFEFNEQELEDLNKALNASVKQLAIYDHEQRTFFQNVSHELRTPLMSIKCYAEGINFGIMNPAEASETILRETDKLTELVKDLLYVAQIDNLTTTYIKKKVDLIGIIHASANRQQALADKNGIQFTFVFEESELPYTGIEELLSRLIDNLISNAIRYAHSEIIISCVKKNGDIELAVTDDGAGIESEILPHVFERFYKGKKGNTGIGLSIVKSIAGQHGGLVSAKNLPAGGAIFTITLKE